MFKKPSFADGITYWAGTEATVNGVLGGYGTTSVPRLDAAASRMLILSILPQLSTIIPPHHSRKQPSTNSTTTSTNQLSTIPPRRSFRALDCGAGIGRVSSNVLLPLFNRVDIVEPVEKFLQTAESSAKIGKDGWKAVKESESTGKGVRMWLAGLQFFDPRTPSVPVPPLNVGDEEGTSNLFAQIGDSSLVWPEPSSPTPEEDGYDLVMIQWCIGHLSDSELVAFLQRSQKALRRSENGLEGYIMLKENTCTDQASEGLGRLFDVEDSSITRSESVFRKVFAEAGLTVIRREVQMGFPAELFPVISYILR